jgi:D-alanyl-D-alanine carboxypeptidase/D-alanyl-D-alanine-endopeptidase (penicillin-binding protein 4)
VSSVRGAGILVQGRHALYVSSLAALLADLGARVQVLDSNRPLPDRPPAGAELLILESPLPAELRRAARLGLPVVVVAERGGAEQEHAAAQLGAGALVEKGATLRELGEAIEQARRAPARRAAGAAETLTPRQREVLELIVEGLDNRQIAARLGVSERTARAHTSGVLKRLGEPNRTRAAVAALRRGLLSCLVLTLACAALASTAAARTPATKSPQALARVVSAQMRAAGGGSGAWVFETGAGRLITAVRSEKRRAPASVQKLLTTAAALERFGPDYRFETSLLATAQPAEGVLQGHLYLRGSGDPSLAETGLTQLARQVEDAGITEIDGRVLGDDSMFDGRRGVPASGYAVSRWVGPLSALSLNHGLAWPVARGFQSQPALFAARRMDLRLDRAGVDVARAARTGHAPSSAVPLVTVASRPLASLVRHMGQVSDNFYAETLIKALGANFGSSGSTGSGAEVVQRVARGLGAGGRVIDGSGLSRANAVSPAAVGRLLAAARRQSWFDAFYRSLPLAGRSGTLARRMRNTAAKGRCRAKTGTLIAVSALAGYCRSRSNRTFAFALLMNGVNVSAARAIQDRIASALAAYRG